MGNLVVQRNVYPALNHNPKCFGTCTQKLVQCLNTTLVLSDHRVVTSGVFSFLNPNNEPGFIWLLFIYLLASSALYIVTTSAHILVTFLSWILSYYPPWKRGDIGLSLSVCPSVRPSVPLDIGYFVHASLGWRSWARAFKILYTHKPRSEVVPRQSFISIGWKLSILEHFKNCRF